MGKGPNVSAITLSWHFPARLFHHHHHRNISKTQLNLICVVPSVNCNSLTCNRNQQIGFLQSKCDYTFRRVFNTIFRQTYQRDRNTCNLNHATFELTNIRAMNDLRMILIKLFFIERSRKGRKFVTVEPLFMDTR